MARVGIEILIKDITGFSRTEKRKKRWTKTRKSSKKRRRRTMVWRTGKGYTRGKKIKKGSAGSRRTKKRSAGGRKTKRGSARGRRIKKRSARDLKTKKKSVEGRRIKSRNAGGRKTSILVIGILVIINILVIPRHLGQPIGKFLLWLGEFLLWLLALNIASLSLVTYSFPKDPLLYPRRFCP